MKAPDSGTMKMNLLLVVFIATVVCAGLVAGLFYGYSCSVTGGLGRLDDKSYLAAFQSINTEIQNPIFFLSFFGSAVLLPLSAFLNYRSGATGTGWWIAAAALYLIGVMGVTIAGNIPLNEKLASFSISAATKSELAQMREQFERSWNSYHRIRTIAAVLAFVLSIAGIIRLKISG